MINYLLAKSIKASAALARIGQGYSPSRRRIIVRQNKGGVLTNLAKIYSQSSKF